MGPNESNVEVHTNGAASGSTQPLCAYAMIVVALSAVNDSALEGRDGQDAQVRERALPHNEEGRTLRESTQ